jgi:hypothetical protein
MPHKIDENLVTKMVEQLVLEREDNLQQESSEVSTDTVIFPANGIKAGINPE